MQTRLINLWDALRVSFWFVPGLLTLGALALSAVMTWADARFGSTLRGHLEWLEMSQETAIAILSTIGGAMFTIAGVVFSISFVTLSLASSQFGPRLLRTFMSNRLTQLALGIFVGTGLYCVVVLAMSRSGSDLEFVPSTSVLMGVLLCVCSIAALIAFIHSMATLIQAPNIVSSVAHELDLAIDRLYPAKGHAAGEAPDCAETVQDRIAELGSPDWTVDSPHSGYLQAIDLSSLVELAEKHNLVFHARCRPGAFVTEQMHLLDVWGEPDHASTLEQQLRRTCILGNRTTPRQDVESAVEELVELAVRALSAGVNDPFTAIFCIDHLGASLSRLARRPVPSPFHRDTHGTVRVVLEKPRFPNVLEAAFNPIRQYGVAAVPVLTRMIEKLAVMAQCARRDEDRAAIRRQAAMILRNAEESIREPNDLADVRSRYELLARALAPEGCAHLPGAAKDTPAPQALE